MKLHKGCKPHCLLKVNQRDLSLDRRFFADLRQVLRHMSQESIALDVLNGSVNRETFNRYQNDWSGELDGSKAFAVVMSALLRVEYSVKPLASHYPRPVAKSELARIRELIYSYGVSCARGQCCSVVPLEFKRAA